MRLVVDNPVLPNEVVEEFVGRLARLIPEGANIDAPEFDLDRVRGLGCEIVETFGRAGLLQVGRAVRDVGNGADEAVCVAWEEFGYGWWL